MLQADVTRETLVLDNARVRLAASLETFAAGNLIVPTAMAALAVAGFALGYSLGPWVVPLAVVIMVLGVRAFVNSWSEALLLASMVAVTHRRPHTPGASTPSCKTLELQGH